MEIQFAHGKPVALNGEAMPLAELIMKLDKIAGKHGIGRIDHVENRLVGIKSREIYECPAATVLLKAHKDLEDLTLEREAAHFKPVVELKMANLIYNGLWYSPLMKAIQAFIKETQKTSTARFGSSCLKATLSVKVGSHLIPYTTRIWLPTPLPMNLIRKLLVASSSFGNCLTRSMLKCRPMLPRTNLNLA